MTRLALAVSVVDHVVMPRRAPWAAQNLAAVNEAARAAVQERLAAHAKVCCSCRLSKDLAEYTPCPSKPDGRYARCRECDAARQRARTRARTSRRNELVAELLAERMRQLAAIRVEALADCRQPAPVESPACYTGTWTADGWMHDTACPARREPVTARELARARNGL
jgi:hypothetical protein